MMQRPGTIHPKSNIPADSQWCADCVTNRRFWVTGTAYNWLLLAPKMHKSFWFDIILISWRWFGNNDSVRAVPIMECRIGWAMPIASSIARSSLQCNWSTMITVIETKCTDKRVRRVWMLCSNSVHCHWQWFCSDILFWLISERLLIVPGWLTTGSGWNHRQLDVSWLLVKVDWNWKQTKAEYRFKYFSA